MNFVDPKEYDIPGLVRKNRYKTILPSEYSLPLTFKTLTSAWASRVTRRPGKGMEGGGAR